MNWNELTMAQKNELMQTYTRNGVTSLDDMRSHFNSFATGEPEDPPTVLPVNEEGLPYYTLPDLEVTAERLPQAKATDANIQRYANAVASGQLKLTQISNTELRNRVRAKPIVDQIMRDRDKTLAPILMGTVGMPAAIIGGISAAPTVAAIMNNPIVDAGLTIQGAVTAPRNIKEGVHEIREGKYGKGALDLGLTALDLYGGSKLIKHGKNVTKRAAESIMRMSSAPYREIKPMVNTLRDDYKYILFKGKPKFGDYTGVFNHTGEQINIPYQNDVISAYLYGNKLDPRLGKLVGYDKSLYGAHTNYIKRNYKRKMGRIPVYELGEPSEHIYPYLQEAIDLKEPTGLVGEMNTLKDGITINTSGHIVVPENIGVQKGAIEQDIWKFNPDDYRRRWDKKTNDFHGNDMNPISRFGLKILDKMGTPIIFKSKPIIP